jgi:hypothetical protein
MRLWQLVVVTWAAIGAMFIGFAYAPTAAMPSSLKNACKNVSASELDRDICRPG